MKDRNKIMNYAFFIGCNIPAHLNQYESSARAVLGRFNIDLTDIAQFNCCGYPMRNMDHEAFVLSSARNLALAAKKDLNIMSLCKCCYGSLKKAHCLLKENASFREDINRTLNREGLKFEGDIEVKHFLSVLYHEVGLEVISEKMEHSFKDLKIATHYGCHALRPSNIVQFDDPVAPVIFDRLVEVTGALSVDWPAKLECCGAPLLGINNELSMDLTEKKLRSGKQSGANYLCSACTYCQIQFDHVQKMIQSVRDTDQQLPSLLYSQLLGLSMGIEKELLGLESNHLPIDRIDDFFIENRDMADE